MKKFLLLLVFMFLFNTHSFAEDKNLSLNGKAAILIDGETGEILYEKNAHTKLYPASTTKIMTAIFALELSDLDDIITIDQEVLDLTDGNHIALELGEELSLEQLLNALLIESANDSVISIAKHVFVSLNSFSKLMNEKAEEVGTHNTNFVNPNGLHDDSHVSTAHDLALIGKYAMGNETFRSIVRKHTYDIPITNKKNKTRHLNSATNFYIVIKKLI